MHNTTNGYRIMITRLATYKSCYHLIQISRIHTFHSTSQGWMFLFEHTKFYAMLQLQSFCSRIELFFRGFFFLAHALSIVQVQYSYYTNQYFVVHRYCTNISFRTFVYLLLSL